MATKIEFLTLILEGIEAHISLPNNAPLLSILRFGTAQRDCIVQQAQADLSCSFNSSVALRRLLSSVFATAIGSHLLGSSTHPFSASSAVWPFLTSIQIYRLFVPSRGTGGPVVSLDPSVAWVGGHLSGEVQEQGQERAELPRCAERLFLSEHE